VYVRVAGGVGGQQRAAQPGCGGCEDGDAFVQVALARIFRDLVDRHGRRGSCPAWS
jgi:hypothetical protein